MQLDADRLNGFGWICHGHTRKFQLQQITLRQLPSCHIVLLRARAVQAFNRILGLDSS